MSEKKKEMSAKETFIRESIEFLQSEKVTYYRRGPVLYLDTVALHGTKLLELGGAELRAFLLRLGKTMKNVLLLRADADLIIEHVSCYAEQVALPLSKDARALREGNDILINTGRENEVIRISGDGTWKIASETRRLFAPMPERMRMVVPEQCPATEFPAILREGIADFGHKHCLIAVSCATMLFPADTVHPFIVFTGDQSRGKSTTMTLIVRLIDPYYGSELMTVGEDMRDLIALVRGRHSIALDNVSDLPFEEDLLSKMYSGGMFAARKMTTNSELFEVELPRLRVMMNGIGTSFTRSDLMSRCMFIEHPMLARMEQGQETFSSLLLVEKRWETLLPRGLGSLLSSIAVGNRLFLERGGYDGKTSCARFVEYSILGECIAEAMGFPPGMFTEQVKISVQEQKDQAIECDEAAGLHISIFCGEQSQANIDIPF